MSRGLGHGLWPWAAEEPLSAGDNACCRSAEHCLSDRRYRVDEELHKMTVKDIVRVDTVVRQSKYQQLNPSSQTDDIHHKNEITYWWCLNPGG